MSKELYYIYVMTDRTHADFCTGITCHLRHQIYVEKKKIVDNCIHRNGKTKLVYYEITESIDEAIERERIIREQLRHLIHEKINRLNPEWKDLTESLDAHLDLINNPALVAAAA